MSILSKTYQNNKEQLLLCVQESNLLKENNTNFFNGSPKIYSVTSNLLPINPTQ